MSSVDFNVINHVVPNCQISDGYWNGLIIEITKMLESCRTFILYKLLALPNNLLTLEAVSDYFLRLLTVSGEFLLSNCF